jgi:hypothetical protein
MLGLFDLNFRILPFEKRTPPLTGLFRLFLLAGVGGCNALRTQALFKYLSFRSPPPLPELSSTKALNPEFLYQLAHLY